MEQLNGDAVKKCQLDIFKIFKSFCIEHHLLYYLCYGTLLGAVRHKGYIPWDDDIDIAMPRSDYEKFIRSFNSGDCQVISCETNFEYALPFAKVYDSTTVLKEESNIMTTEIGVNIDIFPIDILPDSEKQRKALFKHIKMLRNFLDLKSIPIRKRSFIKNLVLRVGKMLLWGVNPNSLAKRINQIAMDCEESGYKGVAVWGYGEREAVKSNLFIENMKIEFENIECNAPTGYRKWLTAIYGDYMKLPPVKKRVNHHIYSAYKKPNTNEKLIVWFITPPNNLKEVMEEVAMQWNGDVLFISLHNLTDERKNVGWNTSISADIPFIVLDNIPDSEKYATEVFMNNPDAINVFCGMVSGPGKYLKLYKRIKSISHKVIVISEKPALIGNRYKVLAKKVFGTLYYSYIRRVNEKTVKMLFATGKSSMTAFIKYGWNKNIVFNFMYTPNKNAFATAPVIHNAHNPIRFLYVGRFNYKTRGLDILMTAFDKLGKYHGWSLDLVGGYGENVDEVISWAEKTNNVRYIGKWMPDDVKNNMNQYDVYICPAKIDGWNTQINEALLSGMGVITTNAAGSDEMVAASGAGEVIEASDASALYQSIKRVIDNPAIITVWNKKAIQYTPRIQPDIIASYMIKCIEYTFKLNKDIKTPLCPWIEDKT